MVHIDGSILAFGGNMDSVRFQSACDEVIDKERIRTGIGTLAERTLHAVLKRYFEPDTAHHEIKVGKYIADIFNEKGITEIQTRSFNRLRAKLEAFLTHTDVTVVYPIARTKHLRWIDADTGEVTPSRKSPKTGRVYDAFPELYKIKPLLLNPKLHLCLVLLDVTEYRCLDGWSKDKKKGSTRFDRIPDGLVTTLYINSAADYSLLVPEKLCEPFTSKEYAKAAHVPVRCAQTALNVLEFVGVVVRIGKRSREYEYNRNP